MGNVDVIPLATNDWIRLVIKICDVFHAYSMHRIYCLC